MFDEKTPLGRDIKTWAKKSNREVLIRFFPKKFRMISVDFVGSLIHTDTLCLDFW